MSNSAEARTEVVSRAMEGLRALFAAQELNRDSLKGVETLLAELIESRELFSSADFPEPSGDEEAKIYLLAEDEGSSNSLYLVCAASGTKAPAHDHQTWAAIGGLEGEEVNYIFERVDDGSEEGKAELKQTDTIVLRSGDSLAFMPDDIHGIEAKDGNTRHFHWYGKGFNEQHGRKAFVDGAYFEIPTGMLPIDTSRKVI